MGDRDRRGDGGPSRKRAFDQERGGQKDRGFPIDVGSLLHFRMLVAMKKAGSVIGKGGEFIQMTKTMTGAKVGVDKPVGVFDERLVHVQGPDEPNKPMAGVQEAVLRTAERIMGEEGPGGVIKLPHKCQLRMLLFKYQIGAVMGKKGSTINEIRNKSAASLKLLTPQNGVPIVPCAGTDDELITIAGTPEQVLNAVKMISEKLRAVPAPGSAGGDRRDREMDRGDPKRSRGPGPDPRHGDPGPPPPWEIPQDHRGPPGPGPGPGMPPPGPGGGPPGNVIAMALPPAARGVLANNDSVKTEGLAGLVTVEYRLLVPLRRSGVILGSKGGVIKDIRNRTGARVHLYDEEKNAADRILQVMSTEDVQDQHCAAFDAAMDCIHTLVHDELLNGESGVGSVRIILPHGQVGAVMGKAGSTIKELRNVTGCSIHLSAYPDVPRCVKKGEEVMELRGPRDAVMLASHIALVAIRGNMGRGQLIYNYPTPPGAPPPTPRGPPPGALPPPHLAGPPMMGQGPPGADPRLQHQQHGPPPQQVQHHGMPPPQQQGPPRTRSRWDSDAPPSAAPPAPAMQGMPAVQGLPGPGQLPGPPPAGVPGAPLQQHVVYEHAPPPQAVQYGAPPPPQQQHVQPHQLPPPQQQPQVQYVQQQGPPPQNAPIAAAGQPPPQQVVMFTNQPPPAGYAPQQVQVQPQQQQPGQPEYASYVPQQLQPQPQQQQQLPPQQIVHTVQQPPPGSQPMVMYPGATGQPQYVEQHHVQQQPQQQVVAVAQQQPALQQPQQQPPTYVFAPAPAAAPAHTAAPHSASGPASTGYGGLAGLVAPAAAPAPAPAPAPAALPNARVLLNHEQVVQMRLDDPLQCKQLSALSGAVIVLSDKPAEHGAREVLLTGSDHACNTAKNLMEALMRSTQ